MPSETRFLRKDKEKDRIDGKTRGRRKQLLEYLKEAIGYRKLKEET
jgi:hypothetical protein